MKLRTYLATPTTFRALTAGFLDTPEWEAMSEWAKFHGLDPNRMPLLDPIVRDEEKRQIRYVEHLFTRDGQLVVVGLDPITAYRVEQGEAPPLPWPSIIETGPEPPVPLPSTDPVRQQTSPHPEAQTEGRP